MMTFVPSRAIKPFMLGVAWALLAFFVLVPSLSFASPDAPADKLVVKVWEIPRQGEWDVSRRAQRAVIDAFSAKPENRNVELTRFSGLQMRGQGQEVGPLMAIAGGTAPDILYVNFRKSDSYIQEGFLHPMDEYLIELSEQRGIPIDPEHPFSDDEVPEILKERVLPPVWPVIYRRGPDGEKHVYCLPFETVVIALMYRKDLFLEAGLDPEKPPRTWDELYDAAARIYDPERGIYGIGLPAGTKSSWCLMSFLWSAGADAVALDEQGVWRAVFDSDEAVLAYDFYRKLVHDPVVKYGREYNGVAYHDVDVQLIDYINRGQIGMWFGYLESAILGKMNPAEVGVGAVPVGPTGISASEINCPMEGLYAGTKDPEVRRKAFEYIWFHDNEEARRITTDIFVQNGFGRFANPNWLRKFGYTDYLRQIPQEWIATFNDALESGKPEPYGKNCDLVYDEMSIPLEDICQDVDVYVGLGDTERRAKIKRVLEAAVAQTDEKMLGILSPEVERFRKRVALVVAVVICAVFCFIFYRIYKTFTPEWARGRSWDFKRYKWAYVILIPAAFTILLWRYVPLARGSVIAFQDYKIIQESRFAGLSNFAYVLFDKLFWQSLWRSTYYMLLMIGLAFWPPILLAILLQEVPRFKVLFRVLFYLPAVTTGLVIVFLWKKFYDQSDNGLLNQLIQLYNLIPMWLSQLAPSLAWFEHLTLKTQSWIADRRLAMFCVILPQVWASMGPGCIIYLAALKSIPEDFYEAADIDGAGFVGKILHIVIPYLKPLIIINFVGAFVAAFKSVEFVFVMTEGGPAQATHVLGFEIWMRSFMYLKFGIGTAMAWILGSLLIGFTAYQLRILSRLQFTTAGRKPEEA
ncbi:MAG TPA: extracellular solute-binding protein [Candidatus Hydrogenedentes bacterium]|nr:extracellular solute-binding protein [Candidatus Hydrogenedentota bacterium]